MQRLFGANKMDDTIGILSIIIIVIQLVFLIGSIFPTEKSLKTISMRMEQRDNFLFEKLRKRNIEQKRNAQFLAYRELCIFVNKYF